MPTYPVTVTTRSGKGSAINAAEFDQNLVTLKDCANDLNTRVAAVTGGTTPAGNADKVDGFHASQTSGANLVVVADASGKADTWITDASTSAKGKVQLATSTEVAAGTDAAKAVTPATLGTTAAPAANKIPRADANGTLLAWITAASESSAGKVQLATPAEAVAGTDTAKAVTAAALAAAILAACGIDPGDIPKIETLGTAAYLDQTWLYASATWDAGSCVTAAQVSTTVAVPGAEIGDKVLPSASIALSGLNLRGEVTAAEVVTLYLSNLTGSAVDLASATYYVAVLKRTPAR